MKKWEKAFWTALLVGEWLFCRYALFALHGMREWPAVLFGLGAVVMTVAFFARAKWTVRAAAGGYLPAALLGVMTFQEGVDPGGGRTSNLWIIWTVSYLVLMVLGAAADAVSRAKGRK